MDNNEELYSVKIARNQIQKKIDALKQSTRYTSMVTENPELEKRGDYKKLVQDSELLVALQEKLDNLSSISENSSYIDDERIEKRDKQIADLNKQIRETQALISAINSNSNYGRDRKNREKLTKKVEKLKKKQGSIQQSQYIAINRIYLDEIEKIEKEASRHGRDSELERRKDRNTNRANEATDYLENFEWSDKKGIGKVIENIGKAGKYVGEVFVGLVSSAREQLLQKHIEHIEIKDGFVDGARKIPSKLGNAIKTKIQEIYSNSRQHNSR